jgi:hypothetical protein
MGKRAIHGLLYGGIHSRGFMSLYSELLAAGCELDNHESDLYVKVDATSRPIVERWCWVRRVHRCSLFASAGCQWWDVPFAFDPWWNRG